MPLSPFRVVVSDLVGRSGARRSETLIGPLEIELDQLHSCGDATARLELEAIANGLIVRGSVEASAVVRCNRCLITFGFEASASVIQVYGPADEEEILRIGSDGSIDLGPVLHDELSLAFPLVPLCSESCLGLCLRCGTDLNVDPCSGHPEESSSPFAVLEELLDTPMPTDG